MKMALVLTTAFLLTQNCFAEVTVAPPEISPTVRQDLAVRKDRSKEEVRARPNLNMLQPDTDGEIGTGEYQVISADGSITRRPCAYTCEMRGLMEGKCRTWISKIDPNLCYVQDTRSRSDAIPMK